ncbi:hypothetical protein [Propionivibrio sp.]|uniref:hypothetical protein n=1 Tax=Propionivibrio sp. TaxID=2212460 RepID=UPI003BF45900
MSVNAQDRLEQRFQIAARERADLIISALAEPLKQLTVLQCLFHSVGEVDWQVFNKFVEPMLGQPGVRGFGWMPAVDAADRLARQPPRPAVAGSQATHSSLAAEGWR